MINTAHVAAHKAVVEAWMRDAVAGDARLGRGDANFQASPAVALKPHLKALRARGIVVYAGSGNVVLADVRGATPVVLQRRPLAQRQLRLRPIYGI